MSDTGARGPTARSAWPEIRTVSMGDVVAILAAGLRDFRAAPRHGILIAGIYAVGGWILVLLLLYLDLPFMVYPLAAGFALIAPFIATGFYAISRALERGDPVTMSALLDALRAAVRSDLGWMALITGFSLFIWMDIAALLFFGFLGLDALNTDALLGRIFMTPSGLLFLVIGNAAGAVIALGVFSISVTSFPMLFDREVDFVTAMITSVKVVTGSPLPMIAWCATIAVLVGLSLLSGFVGLFIVLPVLGHASWHLYRRAVGPAATVTE